MLGNFVLGRRTTEQIAPAGGSRTISTLARTSLAVPVRTRTDGAGRSAPSNCLALEAPVTVVWHEVRIHQAGVVQRGVPAAAPTPAAPCHIVAKPAVGISGFPRGAINALAVRGRACRPRHRRSCGHDHRHRGEENCFFHVSVLSSFVVPLTQLDTSDKGFIPSGMRFTSSRGPAASRHGASEARFQNRRLSTEAASNPSGAGRAISRREPKANSPEAYRKG